MTGKRLLIAAAILTSVTLTQSAQAGIFGKPSASHAQVSDAGLARIRTAIDEQRYLDAGRMLDEALLAGATDTRLDLLGGDLNLARGRYADALTGFKAAEASPVTHAMALQGEGLALASLGRSEEAMTALRAAVAEAPDAWRAWNALGVAYDGHTSWPDSEAAYQRALATADAGGTAIVLNNRGYSRLLQHRLDEAVADFAASLQKKPQFREARTNLRFAMAMKGDYDRALAGASPDEKAALLNNVGFAAGLRGDYSQAEDMLGKAIAMRGEYYARAAANLKLVKDMEARDRAPH
jgi:Flp pilus assembly protein TadD